MGGVRGGCCDARLAPVKIPSVAASVVAAAVVLASCSSTGAEQAPSLVTDQSDDVAFTDCAEQCSGVLDGAEYEILLPETWNGSLLLYSHGYRSASPRPPDFAAVPTAAEPAPGYSRGEDRLAQVLLGQGYALAGSGWATNGWAVEDGVRAANDLYGLFRETVAVPNRVYVWGDSLGGLVTQEIAERYPDWVDGAAPLCGVHAGVVANMDLAMDLAHGVRALIDPGFKTHDYASADEANEAWVQVARGIVTAAQDVQGGGSADVLALGALVDAAPQTQTYDASDPVSRVSGTAEAVLTGLGFGTSGRYDVEQRFGGNISDNTETDYAARFSEEDRALIDLVGGKGATDRIIEKLQSGERVSADPAAVALATEQGGDPSGAVLVPTITIHTAADPLVLVQNQSFLKARYDAYPGAKTDLVQLFTVPPAEYPEAGGAPYGAGHCNFTPESRLGIITLLDGWVRNGIYPSAGRVESTFGEASGYTSVYTPPAWPEPDAVG